MPDKNKSSSDQKGAPHNQPKSITDLDARKEDMSKVKGGRLGRASADPCEGGE